MKAHELRELETAELKDKLVKSHESLLKLRFEMSLNQLKSPLEIRKVKREIARISTILKEKGERA